MKTTFLFILLVLSSCTAKNSLMAADNNSGQAESDREVITSFEECVAAGYPVMRSYPAKCMTKDKLLFTQDIKSLCKDLCGDGECQQLVCMGQGCPCAETEANCPRDCSAR